MRGVKNKKKYKIIKVKIMKCSCSSSHDTERPDWYHNKIDSYVKVFDKIFKDDENKKGLWEATIPTKFYVYLEDTNYKMVIRKEKLKKINETESKNKKM